MREKYGSNIKLFWRSFVKEVLGFNSFCKRITPLLIFVYKQISKTHKMNLKKQH